jgi:ATP-dependent DNA helicase RecG
MRTIPERESLSVEFKSDLKRLPDGELVATVVCLANTEGGEI